MDAELIFDAKATLGEGPIWHAPSQALYWLDILEKRIFTQSGILAQLDDMIGCLAPQSNGNLLLALTSMGGSSSWVDFDPASARLTTLAALPVSPGTRFNDGKCDPAGRFIVGTMDLKEREPIGALYALDAQKTVRQLFSGVTISNGLCWSPDFKTFYYIDTPTRNVQAFDYHLPTGQIANPRTAIHVPASLGWPDGMTADMDGNLWIAIWGGAQVTQWHPGTGRLLQQIPVPALHTSSCVFGGAHMNELYVTSARKGMSSEDLSRYPHSGALFRINTKTIGMPTFEYKSG